MAIIIGHESAREYHRLALAGVVRAPTPYPDDPRTHAVGGTKRAGSSLLAGGELTVGALASHGIYPVPDWLHSRKDISGDEFAAMIGTIGMHHATGYRLAEPLDLLVSRQGARGRNPLIRPHTCSTDLPAGSFLRISKGAFIASPELLFLQMAQSDAPLYAVAAFGCELTGAYSLLPRGLICMNKQLNGRNPLDVSWLTPQDLLDADGYIECPPRTTKDKLRSFLASLPPHTKGAPQALHALKWVKDGSRGPIETRGSLQLRMPRLQGGYSVGNVIFDVRHGLSPDWQRALHEDHLLIHELYYGRRGRKAAVIYLKTDTDTHAAQGNSMRLLRRALEEEGIRTFIVGPSDFSNMTMWEKLAENLATYLGTYHRPPTPAMRQHQIQMHRDFSDPSFLK